MRVAYFTNQYPAVTHTFIRREILALEKLGMSVSRYALRPGENLVDPDDEQEEKKTRYFNRAGAFEIAHCCIILLLTKPLAVVQAIRKAVKLGWWSDRGLFRHLAYVIEAAVIVRWCILDDVQHLHAHFGTNPAAVVMLARQLSGISYSFTAHGPDEFEKAELLSLGEKLRYASFAVCVSHFGRSQLMRWSRSDQWPKIEIIHCGVDSAFTSETAQPPPMAARFTCVGRLSEQKAQVILVAAARRLRDAGVDFEIVLVGDGPMRGEVEEAIRRAGLERKITVAGWMSGEQVKAEILAARALVLPSFAENMPVVIMEALALNRPVVSTYVAGIPELVIPGKTGWIVPAGDEVALANAMQEVLDASVETLEMMGANGRRKIMSEHDSGTEAIKLKRLFEKWCQPHL